MMLTLLYLFWLSQAELSALVACLENTGTRQRCGWEWKHQAKMSKMHHSDVFKWEQLCCCLSNSYSSNSVSSLKVHLQLHTSSCSTLHTAGGWDGGGTWLMLGVGWGAAFTALSHRAVPGGHGEELFPLSAWAGGLGARQRKARGLGQRRAQVQDAGETGN